MICRDIAPQSRVMAVGGPCYIEGCERPRMYSSPVCYKHRENAEDVWWVIEDEGGSTNPDIVTHSPTKNGPLSTRGAK